MRRVRARRAVARRLVLAVLVSACALAVGVLGPASASARLVHKFEFSFNGSGTPTGSFSRVGQVAVEQASGDIWVVEWGAGVVYKFDTAGNYTGVEITGAAVPQGSLGVSYEQGIAVDNSGGVTNGDLYLASENGVVYKFDSSGELLAEVNGSETPAESFSPKGVTVDSSGDLYVADQSNEVVDEFDPSGKYFSQISSTDIERPWWLAIDSSLDLYLGNFFNDTVKFEAGGAASVLDINHTEAVAVDPASDHVFAADLDPTPQIAEYDSAGNRLDVFGAEQFSSRGGLFGIAVRRSTGEAYVADAQNERVDVFGPAVVVPDVTTGRPSNVQPTGATLNGTVNPDGVQITGCQFEYGTTTSYGQTVPCAQTPAEIGSGTSAVPVSANVTLQPDTTYHFRLVASNANGSEAGGDQVLGPPIIDREIVTGVTNAEAILQAQINPFGTETAYHFEYGTTTSYGVSVPVPDASIGSAFGDVTVSQAIGGLLPDTLYHFRVLAANSSGTTPGPDRTFMTEPASCPNEASRQGPSGALPDCRAYEQLTPVDKGDAADLFSDSQEDLGLGSRGYSSESGDQFLLKSESSFANGVSGINVYVFKRDAQAREWGTMAVSQPSLGLQSMQKVVFDPLDFSQLAVQDQVGSTFRANFTDYNLAGPLGGPYTTIASEPFEAGQEGRLGVAGGSADLSHLVVASRDHELVPVAAGLDPASDALYESVGGQVRLIDINNEGSLLSECGAVLGQGFDVAGGTRGAVSRDGSHIVFTAPDPHGHGTGCWDSATTNPPEIYMRLKGTSTVEISGKPEAGVKDATLYPAVFAGASADGSKVFFLTKTELTADDEGAQPELYEYDSEAPEGKRLMRISRGESGRAEGSVDFVAGISQDGSTVYFAAFGALTPGLPPLGAGQTYLYRYDTATGKTTYIARVGGREYPQNPIEETIWYNESLPGSTLSVALNSDAEWYVTGDGRYLVFDSYQHLTGYDSTAASGVNCNHLVVGTGSSENCAELFRYDAAQNSIVCVSCGPPGVPPVDNALFARSYLEQGPAGGPPRPVSEDGSQLFFDTASALVPNTPSGRIHVYEWRNGTISLISSPGDPGNAFFLDSSPDGANVFFGTHAQLSPQDTDVSGDLYDARIGGGFAGLAATACTGTGCQGVPARPPIFATPSSATFEGVGNFPPESKKPAKAKPKPLTRAQKLGQALKACKRDHNKRKRARCEARARKRYGQAHKSTKSNRRGK